jgi:hypothetical protein
MKELPNVRKFTAPEVVAATLMRVLVDLRDALINASS